jgi:outer membrane protein W
MTLLAILAAAAVTTTPMSADVATKQGSMGVEFVLPGGGQPTVGVTYFINDNMALRTDLGLNAQLSPSGVPVLFSLGVGVRLYQFKRDSVAVFLTPSFTLARVAPLVPGGDATVSLIFGGGAGVQYFFTNRFSVGGILGLAFAIGNLGGPTGSSATINLSTGTTGLFAGYYF